jgi:hypothetical protein
MSSMTRVVRAALLAAIAFVISTSTATAFGGNTTCAGPIAGALSSDGADVQADGSLVSHYGTMTLAGDACAVATSPQTANGVGGVTYVGSDDEAAAEAYGAGGRSVYKDALHAGFPLSIAQQFADMDGDGSPNGVPSPTLAVGDVYSSFCAHDDVGWLWYYGCVLRKLASPYGGYRYSLDGSKTIAGIRTGGPYNRIIEVGNDQNYGWGANPPGYRIVDWEPLADYTVGACFNASLGLSFRLASVSYSWPVCPTKVFVDFVAGYFNWMEAGWEGCRGPGWTVGGALATAERRYYTYKNVFHWEPQLDAQNGC